MNLSPSLKLKNTFPTPNVQDIAKDDQEQNKLNVNDVKPSKKLKPKRKRDASSLRKAPQAPKRFKSSYILFFMAKQNEIKAKIGPKASVGEVSKRSSEIWKTLSTDERSHWDEVASKDKQRYMEEKANYTGPWQIPWKRAKKDPTAPKRPMSAFLYFSQDRRRVLKKENPELRNTEISRILGNLWREASEEDKKPHTEKEACQRKKYKVAIAEWREEDACRKEEEKKVQAKIIAEQQLARTNAVPTNSSLSHHQLTSQLLGDQQHGYFHYPQAGHTAQAPYHGYMAGSGLYSQTQQQGGYNLNHQSITGNDNIAQLVRSNQMHAMNTQQFAAAHHGYNYPHQNQSQLGYQISSAYTDAMQQPNQAYEYERNLPTSYPFQSEQDPYTTHS